MNLMQLKYFIAVCTFGTVSGAADYLHIAQPSVSNAIKELENEFGVTLFTRHHRGMVLTAEGEHLLRMSKELLERAERTEKIMKDMGRERKTLILGVPPMTGSLILPNIYSKFLSENEDINLEIVECGRQEMIKRITEDRLDMAFVSHNQQTESGLASFHVSRLEIVCGTTKQNLLSEKKSLSPVELSSVPLVMFEDGFFQTAEIKKWFAKEGVNPDILMQTSQLSTMLSIISSNTAVGFMFKKLIEKNSDIVPISMAPKIFVDISLVWKKDKYLFSGMRRFKDFLSNENLFE
jgi:DNA-binding transcriptional LysR family regulator